LLVEGEKRERENKESKIRVEVICCMYVSMLRSTFYHFIYCKIIDSFMIQVVNMYVCIVQVLTHLQLHENSN
jgi:hypothetical protein